MVIDHLSEIKLIRTDTTLDLSQKAEKVWAHEFGSAYERWEISLYRPTIAMTLDTIFHFGIGAQNDAGLSQ